MLSQFCIIKLSSFIHNLYSLFSRNSGVLMCIGWQWIIGARLESSYGSAAASIPCLVIRVRDLKDPEGTIAWLVHEPTEWLKIINSQLP